MEYILKNLEGGILRIQLNRPEKRNALTLDMYTAIAELLEAAQVKPEIRVVLVHASGEHFSAGNDLQDFLDHPPGSGESPQRRMMNALRLLDKPLVGAVRGAAIGSGATMLTYFDFVYAGQSGKFQYPFINLALVPEFGTSFSLPDQVGYLRAAEIILLGHPFDASQALSMGLATKVLPDAEVLATADKIAQELAQKPLAALKASKQLLRRQVRPRVDQATQDELMEFSERVRSADAREALTAFFEKRSPRFNSGETV
ncbi:MAG TPA: enoyl-CoA hydratase [Edaphobacter sp.]|nr:enoyl-CoA hydratase [Edaphobacter sp.]